MQLDGTIPTKCPPEQVVLLLLDPGALRDLLPRGCEVGEREGDTVPFVIRRKVGPMRLSMSGNLTLTRAAEGPGYDLAISASHIVAGRLRVDLALVPDARQGAVKRLRWNGNLEVQGLAARLVDGRARHIKGIIEDLFANLRDRIEWA